MYYTAHQFDDGTGGDGPFKIYPVRGNGDYSFAGKPGGRDKCYLVHQVHGGATEQCVIVVGAFGENGFEDGGGGGVYSFFDGKRHCGFYFFLIKGTCKFVGLFSGLSKARPSTFLLPLKNKSL